jgi:alpha-ketoglutarate-dependent taurine dioxygenase
MLDLGPGIVVGELSASLGVEVAGLDVRDIEKRRLFDAVRRLLVEKQLIVFKNQTLQPADLEAFTHLFGPADPHVLTEFALAGHPDIFVISNIVENGRPLGSRNEGFGWHTDLIYFEHPAAYTILYALEVPPEGGNTLFASLYRAYDELSEDEKSRLRPLKSIHSYQNMYNQRPNVTPLTPEQIARTPDIAHPLVRIHPETGREGLYLNKETCIGIAGLEPDEGMRLIERLFEFAQQPRFAYSHKWAVHDLVIWDNRGLIHTATPYDVDRYRRLLYRTSVRGERPS